MADIHKAKYQIVQEKQDHSDCFFPCAQAHWGPAWAMADPRRPLALGRPRDMQAEAVGRAPLGSGEQA